MIDEKSLLIHVKPFMRRFMLALCCMMMVAIFTGFLPMVIQPLMDELFQVGTLQLTPEADSIRRAVLDFFHIQGSQLAFFLPLLLFFSFLGSSIFDFFSLYLMKTLGLKVVRNIRDKLYKNLINQSIDFLSKAKTGDLVSRISNDIEKINFAVSETLSVYVREPLTLVVLLVIIFYHDWQMSLYSIVIIPVGGILLSAFGKKVKRRGIQSQEAIGELSNFLTETVIGNKIVKAYNTEEFEINKFAQLNDRHFRINSRIALLYSSLAPIMHAIGGLVAALIMFLGYQRINAGSMTPGQFMSFMVALFLMYNPIKRLSRAHTDFQQGNAGYERVLHIMNSINTITDKPDARELKNVHGHVEFRDVSFGYDPHTPVIKNVSFKVKPDEMVALVGSSGAGKTTLMNLLIRFYEVNQGAILIDDQDIKSFTIKSLRDSIGLVTQDIFLFNDTVESNIAYGKKDYTMEEIEQAARIARASDFIDELPEKYNTVVGERGIFLSNGQRQRLSIARAVMRKPEILIFDEATSSLDSESEKLIQEAMLDVMKERTTFVIAHRLSTIVEADRILVIDRGTIRETGNHNELLQKKGLYYSLYNLQFPDMNIIM